jgi:Ig domain of plant-specific actin-binding protein
VQLVRRRAYLAAILLALLGAGGGVALAAFTDTTTNASTFSAAATFPPRVVSIPDVNQTAQAGVTLRLTNGSYTTTPASFSYRWLRCDTSGANCAAITGATASSYTPVTADVGSTLRGEVTPAGGTATRSEPTQVVRALAAGPVVAGTNATQVAANMPAITTAAPQVGSAATSSAGTWNITVTLARQWLRCDATGASCVAISGATAATYTPTAADRGSRLRVRVTASATGLQPNFVLTNDSAIVA